MKCEFLIQDAVTKRYSVRTYDNRPVESEVKEKILAYASELQNPLGPKIRIQFIEKETAANGEKLGTYGIIKGAKLYVGVTVPNEEYAMEAIGYDFEKLVLYATSLGLGTCWLGGTFNRSAFTAAMEVKEGEIFPILSPLGYPAQKKSFTEKMMRRSIKADARVSWDKIFFKDNFGIPLTRDDAKEYEFPLEMLRLAPSAVNKQPWRVVMTEEGLHFFENKMIGGESIGFDMQRIDVGIAICHFHMAAEEKGLVGHFERKAPDMDIPSGMTYITSWLRD